MAISSGISLTTISDSVSRAKTEAKETTKTTIRISRILNQNIVTKRNLSSDIKLLKNRRVEREKRNVLIDRISAPLIAVKRRGPRILSASDSGTSVVNRLLGFVGYLTAGWALSNLPTWIGLGEQFVTRITTATSILGNYGDELIKVITDVGDVFSSVVQNLSRFDFSDSSYLVRSSLNELKLSIDSLGDGINQAFQVLIQPFKAIEKVPDAYDKLSSILPGFDGPEPPPSGGGGSMGTAYGIDIGRLATATGAAEGDYDSVGRTVRGGGHGLGRYQFMTYRSDTMAVIRKNAKSVGEEAIAEDLLRRANGSDRNAAEKLLKYFPPKDQDALFATHATNTLTQIKKKYPNATEEFLVRRFGAAHISGSFEDLTTPDRNGTTGAMHGDKIWKAYQKAKPSTPSTAKITPSPTGQTPSITPTGQRRLQKGDIFTKSLGKGVDYIQVTSLVGDGRDHGGIDVAAPYGTYISLRVDCEVVAQGPYDTYGILIDVWVPSLGIQLRMAHLSSVLIKSGKIPAGTSFARVGTTGRVRGGPHVHLEYDTKRGTRGGGALNDDPQNYQANLEKYVRLLYLTNTPVGKAFSGTTPLVPGALSISTQQAPEVGMESTITLQSLLAGLSQEREGKKVVVIDDRQPSTPMMIPSGDSSIISDISIDESSILNSLIKNRFLLDLSYV